MSKRHVLLVIILLFSFSGFAVWMSAQNREQNSNVIRVTVAMVQLNVAVTDTKGDYVTGLRPSDFTISEDGISQNVATFEEGDEGPQNVLDAAKDAKSSKGSDPMVERRSGEASSRGGATGAP